MAEKCPSCGHMNPAAAAKCQQCGQPFPTVTCPGCKREYLRGIRERHSFSAHTTRTPARGRPAAAILISRFAIALALIATVVVAAFAISTAGPPQAAADEGWLIRSFDAHYAIDKNAVVTVMEDLIVDFGSLERHGIFRDIPVEYAYDAESNRLAEISEISVDDGAVPIPFETSRLGPNRRIKIGDPDKLITGQQRYVITYAVSGGLNAFGDHDELFWNVTGNQWPVTIERATASVEVPGPGIQRVTCFQGPTRSTDPCSSSADESRATFSTTTPLPPGSGLTLVVALEKGLVQVPPPVLVPVAEETGWAKVGEEVSDFLGLNPLGITLSALVAAIVFGVLLRQWWIVGRDRWFGNTYYLSERPQAETKPLFARETVVVEYQPPEILGNGRRLRPAEIGLLLDERADTLDVSATIVDLAVRKYILIKELPKEGLFGIFGSRDYELKKLQKPDEELLPYERKLMGALFGGESTVRLSELKGEFHEDLREVKDELYREALKVHKFFPRNPEAVLIVYRLIGSGIAVIGGVGIWLLGAAFGVGLVALPILLGGLALFLLAPAMPRRTARGWEMYRRCLGFRLYMVTAEQDRQRFAEEANIFDEYLPYAIVFHCARRWATTFEGLGLENRKVDWYVGPTEFVPLDFAVGIRDFSSSVSSTMASTPSSSGDSGSWAGGFSGFSGGGGGGGGGGTW